MEALFVDNSSYASVNATCSNLPGFSVSAGTTLACTGTATAFTVTGTNAGAPGYTCTWRGLDRNTGSGRGGAADCVVKWRHQTCSSPGYREGKHGRVVTCNPSNVDVFIPAEAAYDVCDSVE